MLFRILHKRYVDEEKLVKQRDSTVAVLRCGALRCATERFATRATDAPASRVSSTIRCFSSTDRRRLVICLSVSTVVRSEVSINSDLDLNLACLDVWKKMNGQWKVVDGTNTPTEPLSTEMYKMEPSPGMPTPTS